MEPTSVVSGKKIEKNYMREEKGGQGEKSGKKETYHLPIIIIEKTKSMIMG
jgi:hypothetical protein